MALPGADARVMVKREPARSAMNGARAVGTPQPTPLYRTRVTAIARVVPAGDVGEWLKPAVC